MNVRNALLVLLLIVLIAGCGGNGGTGDDAPEPEPPAAGPMVPEGQLSVADAKKQGGAGLRIYTWVLVRAETWLLCNRLDQTSYPPECVAPTLTIANPVTLEALKLTKGIGQAGGLLWTESPVSVTGDVEGDMVTVKNVAQG